jgi:hypothetical protein
MYPPRSMRSILGSRVGERARPTQLDHDEDTQLAYLAETATGAQCIESGYGLHRVTDKGRDGEVRFGWES